MNKLYFLLATLLITGTSIQAEDWNEFRGGILQGVASDATYPTEWSKESNLKWSVKLPASGNGSPIVVDGRVYVTCATNEGKTRSLYCFDRKDGSELWVQSVEYVEPEETHKTNPHSAPTPACDGKHVVVWHGSAGLFCYNTSGKQLWSRDLGKFNHIWGYASSPVLYEGKVIQLCGPGDRQFLTALDLKTGETLWEYDEPGGSASGNGRYIGSWATPVITSVNDKDEILCGLPTRVASFDPTTGKLKWFVTGIASQRSDLMYTTPLVAGDFAVAMGGFKGPAMGFTLGGSGDVTEANRKWHTGEKSDQPQRIGSGAIIDGVVYMANADDQGSIQAIDMKTGEQLWVVRRTSDGPHWASLVVVNGKLHAHGQNGITRVFAANPKEFKEIAVNDLGEQMNATPAYADGDLFLRTWQGLYCVGAK